MAPYEIETDELECRSYFARTSAVDAFTGKRVFVSLYIPPAGNANIRVQRMRAAITDVYGPNVAECALIQDKPSWTFNFDECVSANEYVSRYFNRSALNRMVTLPAVCERRVLSGSDPAEYVLTVHALPDDAKEQCDALRLVCVRAEFLRVFQINNNRPYERAAWLYEKYSPLCDDDNAPTKDLLGNNVFVEVENQQLICGDGHRSALMLLNASSISDTERKMLHTMFRSLLSFTGCKLKYDKCAPYMKLYTARRRTNLNVNASRIKSAEEMRHFLDKLRGKEENLPIA
ncbi:hypothetical protein CYMTET_52253 [Cymbomonas tetramitiformis]|uniref:Uncharacterized protein n=1 Tax=Cymbomonas tetramitiformis TaxID=36881 RepID=A0AAE0BKT7_9CHLO|nr:hypothetical protein CYMTET_52253 [Cymbomonas tetramitiformis]